MLDFYHKYYYYLLAILIILILLVLFYIYIVILDKKLNKLENEIKKLFIERINFIPILFFLTEGKIKMHSKIFENILEYRKLGIFSYKDMLFSHIIKNEIKIHKELIFIFKVINKLKTLKTKNDYIYVENFFSENSKKIADKIYIYKYYSKLLNTLIKIKNFTILGLLIPIKKRKIID